MKKSKLYVIFPSSVMGGHEIMAAKIIENMALDAIDITLLMNRDNIRLLSLFREKNIDFIKYSMTFMHSFFFGVRVFNLFSVVSTLRKIKKNRGVVLLVQGTIEHGLEFIWAARVLGVPVASYIPLTDSFRSMGFLFSMFRDLLSIVTYRCCLNYFVISYSSLNKVKNLNPKASVNLLRNFVDERLFREFKYDESRQVYDIYLIGRIVFSQKAQDKLIDVFRSMPPEIAKKIRLNFVGDGPDIEKLRELSRGLNVVFHGWVEKWWEINGAIDLVVINSKFEGVPLVMLESIALGIPVIAPDKDGMPEYLSIENLFCSSVGSALPTLQELLIKIFESNPSYYLSRLTINSKNVVYSKEDITRFEKFAFEASK